MDYLNFVYERNESLFYDSQRLQNYDIDIIPHLAKIILINLVMYEAQQNKHQKGTCHIQQKGHS